MHNKEKLHKNFNQKRFSINNVFHEIFKRNRNIIKKLLRIPELITSIITSSRAKMIWEELFEKIMQVTNVNKRFTALPTMIKHEKHIMNNRAKLSENSYGFLRSLGKKFEDKVFTSHEKVHENAIIQNEKAERAEKWYFRPAIMRIFPVVSIRK